jgi:hypothetical protein
VESGFVDEWVSMTRDTLVTYLTTQSGAVAAIETGQTTLDKLEEFLQEGLSALLHSGISEFRFGGPVHYLRRR